MPRREKNRCARRHDARFERPRGATEEDLRMRSRWKWTDQRDQNFIARCTASYYQAGEILVGPQQIGGVHD
jgi:hypothetical protein